MPVGIIVNSMSIFLGGLLGTFFENHLSNELKENITLIFGVCSMGMGVNSLVLMVNMPPVILALVVGTAIGIMIRLGKMISLGASQMERPISLIFKNQNTNLSKTEFTTTLVTIIVLFCASGTGIYGSLDSGMTGDHTILISKSILDFFTAAIFACSLGAVVSFIAIPQFVIFILLFVGAKFIFPMTTPDMIDDFKACGGFLMLATGFRIIRVKEFPTADMIPAMILVMPFSFIWSTYIAPAL